MSLATIATQLYTIQSRKNVPLKTAFGMIVREDLAMRFSVYNLAKIITKSEFLATVAQTAFGSRTPLQRKQDEAELKKEKQEKRFKQFTASSIANLNNKINLLAGITERNTALISGIYSELGAFRMQRRMNINSFNARAFRIPAPSKTIKAQLEKLSSELADLKKMGKKPGASGVTAKKSPAKEKKEQEANLFSQFLPFILTNPKLLALLGVGALRAVGLGTIAAQAYSLYNLPGAVGRIATRAGGKSAYDSPITEQTSQFVDTGIAALGGYTATRAITGAASMIKNRGMSKLTPVSAVEARRQIQGKMQKEFMKRGMTSQQAFGKASKRSAQFIKYSAQLKKFKVLDSALRGLGRRLPAVQVATVAFELSRMANYTSDRASGTISQDEYRENMTNSYQNLIEYVGMPAMGTVLGGLAGSALFPGVGTSVGMFTGALGGYLASFLLDERSLAEKIFSMVHEDRTEAPKKEPPMNLDDGKGSNAPVPRGASSSSTVKGSDAVELKREGNVVEVREGGDLNWRNNNPGNIRYGEYAISKGAIGENGGFAIFPTMEMGRKAQDDLLRSKNYKDLNLTQAVARWAPAADKNDPAAYINYIVNATGLDPSKKYVDLTPVEKGKFLDAMTKMEGGRAGKIYTGEAIKNRVKTATPVAPETPGKTATPVAPETPSVVTVPNSSVLTPPKENVPMAFKDASTAAELKEKETTEVLAHAGFTAAAALNNKMNAGLKEVGDRILGIERNNPIESPRYTHNDNSLQGFAINQK